MKDSESTFFLTELQSLVDRPDDVDYLKATVGPEEWRQLRKEKTGEWLRAWQRLESEIDRNFDFDDFPVINVSPPSSVDLLGGVAPEHVEDPALRAEYEALIAREAQKASAYNWQYKLRQVDQPFSSKAEQYIVGAYTTLPYDLEALKRLLEAHISDGNVKARILNAVEQKMAESGE